MTERKVLITDKVHPLLIEGLKDMGFIVDYDTSVENEQLEKIIDQYEGIIINSKIIMNHVRIDMGKNLKFIGRLGSGLEIIDVSYARSKGIGVYNSPEGNRNAVAEHEMGMLLALFNNIVRADNELRKFDWNREKNRGRELKGKAIGIIGLGNTGEAFAEKLSSWGMRVLSYDKYRTEYSKSLDFVEKTDLDMILKTADIISLHLPLTSETNQLVNENFIASCKDGVIISNTSRGQIVDTKALIDGLENNKIAGACLDVFENEKPDTFTEEERAMYAKLYSYDNVVLTPHVAGWTNESLRLIASVLLDKIKNNYIR